MSALRVYITGHGKHEYRQSRNTDAQPRQVLREKQRCQNPKHDARQGLEVDPQGVHGRDQPRNHMAGVVRIGRCWQRKLVSQVEGDDDHVQHKF